jgi:hypothetical protein
VWFFKKKQPKPLNALEEKVLEFIKKCTPYNVIAHGYRQGYKRDNCIITNSDFLHSSFYGDRKKSISVIFTNDPRDSGTSFDHPLIIKEYERLDNDYRALHEELKTEEFYKNITKTLEGVK